MKIRILLLEIIFIILISPGTLFSGFKIEQDNNSYIEFNSMVQFWSVYSHKIRDAAGDAIDSRLDMYIRRGRFGAKGKIFRDVSYLVNFAYDNIGKDPLSASTGSPQGQSNLDFYLWDAFFTWGFVPDNFYLTFGYFRPQVGRESILSAFKVGSFTKAITNSYPRNHIVGRGNGRETGSNLGFYYYQNGFGTRTDIGFFDTNFDKITGQGNKWSPLFTARTSLIIGDPEAEKYSVGYNENFFGKRNGITVSFNLTRQGKTNETINPDSTYFGGFLENRMMGMDILANWVYLSISAEVDFLERKFTDDFASLAGIDREYNDFVYFMRAGYTFDFGNGSFIEPSIMFSEFIGDKKSSLYPGGKERVLDLGVNYYLNSNTKINLHYSFQSGNEVSKYSVNGEKKGNFLGLGVQYVW